MKKLNLLFQVCIAFSISLSAFAQPSNDDCSTPISLGTLPTPGACVAGLQNGAATTLNNQTTVGATAPILYTYQTGCTGSGTTMQTFALDTWYSFTATGTTVNVNITGFPNANIGLYSGTCANLLGRGCAIANAAGNGTLVVTQITAGTTYYIQISGNTTSATDANFTIAVDNDIDCNDCLTAATLTATPAPVNGGYTPGQVVQFCYTVSNYNEVNTNWFHGVQVAIGPGWTGTFSGVTPAANCGVDVTPGPGDAGNGVWSWYPAGVTATLGTATLADDIVWPAGFYFDNINVAGTNAGNNFGDPGNCGWTFCWSLTVSAACAPGTNLGVTVNTTGDGESGSWTSSACVDDPASVYSALQVCCTAPTMAATPVTCLGGNNGTATATHGSGSSPWDYVWTNSSGTNVGTTNNSAAASNTVSGLVAGTYTVTITDNVNCVTTNTVVVGPGINCACLITNFTTSIGFCQPDNTFPVSGTVTYTNAPATGTLIVTVTNSSGTYTQTFNPPFVNGTVYNYNITNCISDGSAATVEVHFTADVACTQVMAFTSPIACGCAAQIGTFTDNIIGVSTNNYVLCYGDIIDIQTNNDYTPPAIATSPPGPVYDTGVSWLIYSCPPSIGLVPSATEDVANDPCLLGIMSDFDLNDLNDQFMLNAFPPGTFTNNTIYYVPITMYSIATGTYSYVNTTIPCYDLGTPYAVQYLPQILSSFTQTCSVVTATISGGLPAVNGSQFTAVAGSLTPANATFGNTTCSNNGTIAINGLTQGQAFSFQVQDANGCPKTVSGTFVGPPTLSYPAAAYCKSAANPSPTITGVAGGTYSSTAGLSINAATGLINLAASTAGTYTVTYTTPAVPGPACPATFVITINPLPVIAVPDQTVCAGTAVTLSGNGANTYTWTGGITNGVAFTPAATTTYTVTGTITATGCTSTDPATITVNPLPIVNAGVDQTVCAGVAVTLSGSGASTYTWNNGVTNGVAFTPAATTTYTVTGTSAANCTATDQVLVTVNPLPIVNAGPDVSICTGGSTTLTATGATTYTWTGGITNGVAFSPAATTTYTVTGTTLGCTATDAATVTILPNAAINAGVDVAICLGASTTLTATGGTTYTWNNGLGIGNNFSVSPAVTTTYTVVGTNAAGCTGTDAMTVTVNPLPAPTITGASTYCAGNFSVLSTNIPFTTYLWSNGAATPTINATTALNPITCTVTNAFGCSATTPVFNVAVNNVITVNTSVTICQGQTALIHGVSQSVAGVYSNTTILPTGCDSISNVTLVVNALPIVNAGIDQTVCAGVATTLTATGATTYSWDNGVTNGTAFTQAVGTTTYTVTGTTLGCTNTDQVDITVNPIPVVNAGIDQAVCAGTAVTLSASGATTYSWNNGVTDGVAFTPAATTTYTVTGTSLGCTSTDQVVVTVNPIPAVNAGNDVVICAGATVTLTGSGANTYTWDNGVTNGVAFTPAVGTVVYTVTGTSAAGCINTDQVTVTVNPIPVVSFTPDVTIGCTPLTVNFTNTTVGATNCVWTMSDGTVLNGCGTVTNTFTAPGCYDITLTTTAGGCTNTFTANDLVCVEAIPLAAFIPSASVITEMNPLVHFDNNSIGATTYSWNFGDNSPLSSTENPSHNYSADQIGTYQVMLIATSAFGCADTAYTTIEIQEELIFYVPNTFTPDDDNFNPIFKPIFTSGFDPYDYTLLIFNRWGEIIFESHNSEIGWDGTYGSNHEITMVQDGTYTWKIEFKTTRNDERKMVVGHVNVIR